MLDAQKDELYFGPSKCCDERCLEKQAQAEKDSCCPSFKCVNDKPAPGCGGGLKESYPQVGELQMSNFCTG